jgi:hypothetical protein
MKAERQASRSWDETIFSGAVSPGPDEVKKDRLYGVPGFIAAFEGLMARVPDVKPSENVPVRVRTAGTYRTCLHKLAFPEASRGNELHRLQPRSSKFSVVLCCRLLRPQCCCALCLHPLHRDDRTSSTKDRHTRGRLHFFTGVRPTPRYIRTRTAVKGLDGVWVVVPSFFAVVPPDSSWYHTLPQVDTASQRLLSVWPTNLVDTDP